MLYSKFKSLSFTVRSGEPLVPALKRLKGRFKKTANYIEDGLSLKESAEKAGFESRVVHFLEAGEVTGELEQSLDFLTDFYEMLYKYRKSLTFSFIRSMLFVIGGAVAVFIFNRMFLLDSDSSLILAVSIVACFLTLVFLIIYSLTPGFTKWSIYSTLKFSVKSGLSFFETKKMCNELKLPVKKNTENYSQLFSYPAKYKDLIVSGEETGELEDVFKTLEKESFQELNRRLKTISTMFFYLGVILSMGFILFSISTVFSETFGNLDL